MNITEKIEKYLMDESKTSKAGNIMKMKEYTKIKNGRAYTVRLFDGGGAYTFDQPINPKTGKGWQSTKNSKHYDNHAKAMFAWSKL